MRISDELRAVASWDIFTDAPECEGQVSECRDTMDAAAKWIDALGDIRIEVKVMKLSDGREDHYVSIQRGGREITPHKFSGEYRNRAEYEVAEWKHVLLGHPKPNISDPIYADPKS